MLPTFVDLLHDKRTILTHTALIALMPICGCKTPASAPSTPAEAPKSSYPPRPTVAPPTFKVFHQDKRTYTLVTKDNATDDEVAAILWQLHDTAHAHSFDTLHLSQTFIDARSPNIGFDIYRGTKCAPEKYTDGALPCDASNHSAGEYTLGSFKNPLWDNGVVRRANSSELQLWNPDAAYVTPTPHA
jgi:hypothetical protein